MSLPVVVIITSKSCGHCQNMRNDGQPREPKRAPNGQPLVPGTIKGGHHWSPSFFASLITGTRGPVLPQTMPKWRVYELYFPTLNPRSLGELLEFNEFTLKPGGVTRTTFSPEDEKSEGRSRVLVSIDGSKKSIVPGAPDFRTFVAQRCPAEILNFLYIYPGWVWVNGPTWDGALRGIKHLFAHVSSCFVKSMKDEKSNDIWGVDTDKGYTLAEDPLEVAMSLDNTSAKLYPPKIEAPPPAQAPTIVMETLGAACQKLGFRLVSPQ